MHNTDNSPLVGPTPGVAGSHHGHLHPLHHSGLLPKRRSRTSGTGGSGQALLQCSSCEQWINARGFAKPQRMKGSGGATCRQCVWKGLSNGSSSTSLGHHTQKQMQPGSLSLSLLLTEDSGSTSLDASGSIPSSNLGTDNGSFQLSVEEDSSFSPTCAAITPTSEGNC